MKKLCLILFFSLAPGICDAEEACEPAVDVAETMNVNARQNCNYEKTGLNRIVHQMFNGESSASHSASSAAMNAVPKISLTEPLISTAVNNAQDLSDARFGLLQDIIGRCTHGFRLTDEIYLPVHGELRLKLLYECL